MESNSPQNAKRPSANNRPLFTPRERARITNTLCHGGGVWEHRKSGYQCRLALDRNCPPGEQVAWAICARRRWYNGSAGTVFEALHDIERQLALALLTQ